MAGLAIAILFMLMVAAPCLVALRNSRNNGATEEYYPEGYFEEEIETEELVPAALPEVPILAEIPMSVAGFVPPSREKVSGSWQSAAELRDAALAAEMDAVMARDRADRAHWEALTAAARAASLRADAAAEAAQAAGLAAERALWAAEAEFQFETEPQQENPALRISGSRRRAA